MDVVFTFMAHEQSAIRTSLIYNYAHKSQEVMLVVGDQT